MNIKATQYGFIWDDMELTRLFDDEQGRIFLKIERGSKSYEIYITKTGKLVVNETAKKSSK